MTTAPDTTRPSIDTQLTKELLRRLIADAMELDVTELPADDEDLIDYGLHSVAIMQVISHFRQQGVDVAFRELFGNPTVDGWWTQLEKAGMIDSDAS
ncbi:hypothetical protein VR41_06335 [Streptomyces sp. NRRL B-1568]|nr:hypothetical protein VR41_06335 [Streptomyces sp. NRRL B-1568]